MLDMMVGSMFRVEHMILFIEINGLKNVVHIWKFLEIYIKDLLDSDSLSYLKDIVTDRKFAYPEVEIKELITLFTKYNLRTLPVLDKEKRPIGIVKIDTILEKIEEQTRNDEFI